MYVKDCCSYSPKQCKPHRNETPLKLLWETDKEKILLSVERIMQHATIMEFLVQLLLLEQTKKLGSTDRVFSDVRESIMS